MFGRRLADERKRLGLSQKELGRRQGVSRSAIGMIETDQAMIDIQRLVELGADGFDVLYVLTGEPGTVAAGRLIDWEICCSLLAKIESWERRRGISLTQSSKSTLLKHMYLERARRGAVADGALDELMDLAAA